MRDPLSLAWMRALATLGYPPVHDDKLLALLPRRALREALGAADVAFVSHPYQVRWVKGATPAGTPLVMDGQNVERLLYPPRETRLSKWLASAVAKAEQEAWQRVDLAFAVTPNDAEVMRDAGVRQVVVVPNAADLERLRPVGRDEMVALRRKLGLPLDRSLAVFVGSAHPPNVEALEVLEAQAGAYAEIGVTPVVVGRVGERRRATANLIRAGEVADVAPWLGAADVAINPLRSGGGSSLKMVEYLAAGLPIVTTAIGARGLGLRNGVDAEICDAAAMPAQVARLMADPGHRATLAANARRAAEERFGWDSVGRLAGQALDELVS